MKFRVGFVSNSSSSSFVCTYIGIPSKKIIKKKGGVPFINNQELVVEQDPDEEGYEDEDYEEYGNEDKALQYSLDKFFRKSKIKLQSVGNDIGFKVLSYSDFELVSSDSIGDLNKITKQFEQATAEFTKIGYTGPLQMNIYSEFREG